MKYVLKTQKVLKDWSLNRCLQFER